MTIYIGWSNGVTIQKDNAIFHFDPHTKNNLSDHNFFSHSHSDHTYGLNNNLNNYLTPETRDILYFKGNSSEKFKIIKYCETIQIDSLEIIAHNAGHILGSAQVEIC
jgi:Cft2 family RNA processing exonuclease